MSNLFRWIIWFLLRSLMNLRYRVRSTGFEKVEGKPGPFLVLPNHTAYSDPTLLLAHLWNRFRVRPLGLETNFQNPLFKPFINVFRPIKMPGMEQTSKEARDRAVGAVNEVIEVLRAGDNVMIWPAGALTHDGLEHLGGARTTADVIKAVPNVTVVRVRTRGLFGSSVSYAYTGHRPKMAQKFLAGAAWLLANFLFFGPRRQVTMEVDPAFPGSWPEPTREKINPWLEEWYNRVGAEQPTFRKYHWFLGPQSHVFPPMAKEDHVDVESVPSAVRDEVTRMVEDKLKRPLGDDERKAGTTFRQLGLDSIDTMDIALTVERRFGFQSADVPTSLGNLWALAGGLLDSGTAQPAPELWFRPPSDENRLEIPGETIPEAFLNRALRNPKDVVEADDLSGVMPYEKMLIGVLTLAQRFEEFPGDKVGLLLPASVAADVALLALHFAGKLPVLLNWTTGPSNLAHAAKLTDLKVVVTSKAFIDRTHVEVAGTEYRFLEDLRKTVGKGELLARLLRVKFLPSSIVRRFPAVKSLKPSQPAVILFTSGSEKAPKAVPLSHANIISNHRSAIEPLELTRRDSLIGFLPMFHSFGLTITSLFPILAGVKVVHHPDPTDAAVLAKKIVAYKPTILVATPTFMSFILERLKPGELDFVRVFATAAEKCPEAVQAKARLVAPNAAVLEGYGITECTPIVSLNTIRDNRPGSVGKAIPGVETCVLDVETNEPLPPGQMGMLHVAGPNVFAGYFGGDHPSPFREHAGKSWYITGDLAALTPDGYITFHGRLKRFLKAGGEMLSLPALEEPFALKYPPNDSGPRVAVEGLERDNGTRTVVLFTTEAMTLVEANQLLQQNGMTGIMRLDEVRQIDSIPVLGTGKTDYKKLKAMLT
ncbi:MAG: AMP-binding protein [Gemmataceae bacterium]